MANKRLQRLKRYQRARKAADAKLHAHRNVVGSCFGMKKSEGVRTDQLCVTVFVRRKVGRSKLRQEDRIPDFVQRHGLTLPTDVVVVGKFRNQLGFAIWDGVQVGTLGAFAHKDNKLVGVTCAHCITGTAGDFNIPTSISIKFPENESFGPLGPSISGMSLPGTGISPEFGDFDLGLVDVTAPPVVDYVTTRSSMSVFRPPDLATQQGLLDLLQYLPVQGWGAGSDNIVRGRIEGVMGVWDDKFFDLMIENHSGGGLTHDGDSGMMWTNAAGEALGIHMGGDGPGGDVLSDNAIAYFAFRAVDHLGLSLLST
jgi:hypothetical protein